MKSRIMPSLVTLSTVLSIGFIDTSLQADVPRLLHYQGKLRTADGGAAVGSVNFTLTLYGHPTDPGPVLFGPESHPDVPLTSGLFSIQVGAQTIDGIPDSALDAEEVYLGVTVNNEPELQPRTRIVTTPYAVKTKSAEQLVRPGTLTAAVQVDAGGNVGIGTDAPTQTLEVAGGVQVSGAGNGVSFPDGTVQTTAPQIILSESASPPDGYTYTGNNLSFGSAGGTWTTRQAMPAARLAHAVTATNNRVYVVAGHSGSASIGWTQSYDPATDTWATHAEMPQPRSHVAAAAVNNRIYACGGESGAVGISSLIHEYDVAGDTWSAKPSMFTGRVRLVAVTVGAKLYAIGGNGSGWVPFSANEEFDPAAGGGGTWTSRAGMTTARFGMAAAAIDGVIYVVGGENGGGRLNINEAYTVATDSWASKAPMSVTRTEATAAVLNGKLYVVGGYAGSGVFSQAVEEYDPTGNTWTTRPVMPTGRSAFGAAAVGSAFYALGGYGNSGSGDQFFAVNERFEVTAPAIYYLHRKN